MIPQFYVGWMALVVVVVLAGVGVVSLLARNRGQDDRGCRVRIRRSQDPWMTELGNRWLWSCACRPGSLRYVGSWDEAQAAADAHLREKTEVAA